MDDEEDQEELDVWCKAWRLLQQHGSDVDRVIDAEIARLTQQGDSVGVDDWRQVAAAVNELAQ